MLYNNKNSVIQITLMGKIHPFINKLSLIGKLKLFESFFFLSEISFTIIHESQDCRERGIAYL